MIGSAMVSAGPAPAGPGQAATLPALRDDLTLLPGPSTPEGAPTWSIHDPLRHCYFRLTAEAVAALRQWHLGTADRVLAATALELGRPADPEQLGRLLRFLDENNLLRRAGDQSGLLAAAASTREGWARWLLRHYLFVRLPLLRPDRLLGTLVPRLEFLFSRRAIWAFAAIGLVGMFLAARQWDVFLATASAIASWQGTVYIAVALALAKTVHEFGHAVTAKRSGCRVPTMGVALMVLYPVLYTDLTDTWRLTDRRRRMLIGAGGMLAEGALAAIALLAWSVLPDGPVRSAAFTLAAVSLVGTLVVNASPFMRFDGYFLLSDLLGVENLQGRSFALGRWHLRRTVLGHDAPPPELFPPRRQALLIAFAYATWLYRVVLFLGIALLVYHLFFKLLGLALLVVEVAWFVARPIANELKAWWALRGQIRPNARLAVTLATVAVLVAGVLVPWRGELSMPAVMRSAAYGTVFSPAPARIERVLVAVGDAVVAGQPLIELAAPDLDHELALTAARIAVADIQLSRAGFSAEARAALPVLRQQRARLARMRLGLREMRDRLVLHAPIAGRVVDATKGLRAGLWVGPTTPLVAVADPARPEFIGFLDEADLGRLEPGAGARFVPLDPAAAPTPLRVREIASGSAGHIEYPELASSHGGPIQVRRAGGGPGDDQRDVPVRGLYRVDLEPLPGGGPVIIERCQSGMVIADAAPGSFAARIFDRVAAVFLRESGF